MLLVQGLLQEESQQGEKIIIFGETDEVFNFLKLFHNCQMNDIYRETTNPIVALALAIVR